MSNPKIVKDKIKLLEIEEMAKNRFGNLVKAVVDVEQNLMALDAEMHVDEEQLLLSSGSKQENLWGINLYPEFFGRPDFVEFDSMINLRPNQNNRSRGVESVEVQKKIIEIVNNLIEK
ncbi:MAG: DUF5674 family protein [Patescibacteria group bacterium]|nr:DUF5674 family protein [Patescibacteria group bacterium]